MSTCLVRRGLIAAAATLTTLGAAATPALAAPTGGASVHVTVATGGIRSVTVNTQAVSLNSCLFDTGIVTRSNPSGWTQAGSVVGFPNGICTSAQPVQIDAGSYAGHVDIQTTTAQPSDGGTPWAPVSANVPGADQYQLTTSYSQPTATTPTPHDRSPAVGVAPSCDVAFREAALADSGGGCASFPGEVGTEFLDLRAPSVSSDPSSSFSFTVTWTAVP